MLVQLCSSRQTTARAALHLENVTIKLLFGIIKSGKGLVGPACVYTPCAEREACWEVPPIARTLGWVCMLPPPLTSPGQKTKRKKRQCLLGNFYMPNHLHVSPYLILSGTLYCMYYYTHLQVGKQTHMGYRTLLTITELGSSK